MSYGNHAVGEEIVSASLPAPRYTRHRHSTKQVVYQMSTESTFQFEPRDWQRVTDTWSAWWHGELARPLVLIEQIEGDEAAIKALAPDYVSNLPLELSAEEIVDRYATRLAATRWYGDAMPKWWLNYGPGIAAGFLGAKVHCVPDTVWFEPQQAASIAEVRPVYDADNPWWRRIQDLAAAATARLRDRAVVGFTDIGGNLDIVASLRGTEQLLLDLYDAPDDVERLATTVTRLWLRYYDEHAAILQQGGVGTTPWAAIWSPERCYMLQSDFSYMISPRMFERFILPDLTACCAAMEHGFYHLDGKGQIPHLDMLLSIERLRGIQWIPGDGAPPPEEWLPLLKRIRDGGKLCQVYVTPEGALKIAREIGGRGFVFAIKLDDRRMAEAEIAAFLSEIARI